MNLWGKLSTPSELGPRISAPLPTGLFGAGMMYFTLWSIVNDTIRLGKGPSSELIHFEDHPIAFLLSCAIFLTFACGCLWFARLQF